MPRKTIRLEDRHVRDLLVAGTALVCLPMKGQYERSDDGQHYYRKNATWDSFQSAADLAAHHCPYGPVGAILKGYEAWAILTGNGTRFVYRADGPLTQSGYPGEPIPVKWQSSARMPPQACRVLARVDRIGITRIQLGNYWILDLSRQDH